MAATPTAAPSAEPAKPSLNVRQAAFIGVGAMVGAGIFSLLGAAGEVAGSAVWLSFVIAGAVAGLQGYSFARLGGRYPSAGGLLEYVSAEFGGGHTTGVMGWLIYATNAIVTAMVAVSFGSYAAGAFADGSTRWVKFFSVVVILAMTLLNMAGSQAVARVQTVVVTVVIGILVVFSVATLSNLDTHLIAPSTYPSFTHIISGVALTFFAFLGFGVVTFTAKDLPNPRKQLPRAMYLALGMATVVYLAVSLGVFGTLTVDEVIKSGGTAIAVAAEPVLGRAGYWLMTVTALFATSGATNAGLFPATGLCDRMAELGHFPPALSRRYRDRVSYGLLLTSLVAIGLAAGFDLNAIASIGSAIALLVFAVLSAGHFKVRSETGASPALLALAAASAGVVLVTFVATTLIHDTGSMVAILVVLALSIGLDVAWKARKRERPSSSPTPDDGPRPPDRPTDQSALKASRSLSS